MKRPPLRVALAATSLPFLPISAAKLFERAVAHLVGEVHVVGEGDVALLVGQADMAVRHHRVVDLVVGHLVGEQDAAVAVDLDMAARRDDVCVDVVVHLVGLQQHIALDGRPGSSVVRRRPCPPWRTPRSSARRIEEARGAHPSSVLNTKVMPMRIEAIAGAVAASATGRMPLWPSARANSLKK